MLLYRCREGPHNVESSLGEGPRGVHWSKLFQQLPYSVGKLLALVTRFYIGLGALLYGGPIISYSYELVNW